MPSQRRAPYIRLPSMPVKVSLSSSLCPLSVSSSPCALPREISLCPLYILLWYYFHLPWFFSFYGKANPAFSFLTVFITLFSGMHVSLLSWGAQNFTQYSGCFSAVWEERMKCLLIFWLHSWMLLAFFAARTADSCSPYLSVGTPSSFPANLHATQLDFHLTGGKELFPFRCRTSISCRVRYILVTQVTNKLQVLFSLIEKDA